MGSAMWKLYINTSDIDALYKKCVLIERGSFRPATKVTVDMLRCAQAQFIQEPGVQGEDTPRVSARARHRWCAAQRAPR